MPTLKGTYYKEAKGEEAKSNFAGYESEEIAKLENRLRLRDNTINEQKIVIDGLLAKVSQLTDALKGVSFTPATQLTQQEYVIIQHFKADDESIRLNTAGDFISREAKRARIALPAKEYTLLLRKVS